MHIKCRLSRCFAITCLGQKRMLCFLEPGLRIYKAFSFSTELSRKFIQLMNVKMPTIVGILTFISMINTISERIKARNFFYFFCM